MTGNVHFVDVSRETSGLMGYVYVKETGQIIPAGHFFDMMVWSRGSPYPYEHLQRLCGREYSFETKEIK